jgi:hypothetical protein
MRDTKNDSVTRPLWQWESAAQMLSPVRAAILATLE